MTDTPQDLARRLVEHPKFRWMPGTSAVKGANAARLTQPLGNFVDVEEWLVVENGYQQRTRRLKHGFGWLPDLEDPATLGCLWHLLCESLPEGASVYLEDTGDVEFDHSPDCRSFGSVAHALLWLWSREEA